MSEMTFRPRHREHNVSARVDSSATLPVPFAEPGTTMVLSRVRAEWKQYGTDPWRLDLVTVWGVANNGSGISVDYFPDNLSRQPPAELSAWIASTHPERVREESKP